MGGIGTDSAVVGRVMEWTQEWLEVLPKLGHTFGDDGQFLSSYGMYASFFLKRFFISD